MTDAVLADDGPGQLSPASEPQNEVCTAEDTWSIAGGIRISRRGERRLWTTPQRWWIDGSDCCYEVYGDDEQPNEIPVSRDFGSNVATVPHASRIIFGASE